jgi:hypothetical protein
LKITKIFEGYCPTLDKHYSISVEYVDASSFEDPSLFIQGLATCEYHARFKCPIARDCPIRTKAPKEIRR